MHCHIFVLELCSHVFAIVCSTPFGVSCRDNFMITNTFQTTIPFSRFPNAAGLLSSGRTSSPLTSSRVSPASETASDMSYFPDTSHENGTCKPCVFFFSNYGCGRGNRRRGRRSKWFGFGRIFLNVRHLLGTVAVFKACCWKMMSSRTGLGR